MITARYSICLKACLVCYSTDDIQKYASTAWMEVAIIAEKLT